MANNEKLVVTTYIINKGQPSQYFGLKTLEGDVLHYAPNNWKTEQGAYAWAKKKGYIVKDAKIKDNTFDNVKQVYTAQDKNGKVYYVYEGDYKDYKGTRHIFAVSSQTPEYVKSERNVAGTILPTKEEALKQLKMTVRDDAVGDSISKYNGEDAIKINGFVKIKEDGDWTSYKYNGCDFDNAVFKIHQYNPSLIAFVSNGNRTITVRNKYLNDAANVNMKTAEDIIKKYGGNPVGNVMGLQKTRFVRQDEIKNQHDFAIDLDKAGYKFYLINGKYHISPKDSSIKDDLTMVEKYKKSIIYIDDNGYYYHTPIGGRGAKAQRDNTKDINIVKKRIDNDYSFLYDSSIKDISITNEPILDGLTKKDKFYTIGTKIKEGNKILTVVKVDDRYIYLKHPDGKVYAYDPYDLYMNLKMTHNWSYVDSSIKDVSFVTGKNLKVGQKIIENDKIYEVLDIKDNSSIYSKIVTLKDIKTGKVEQLRIGYNYLTEIKDKLIQSASKEAFSKNMATEIKSGKDPKQAAAIAYSVQRANDSISQYKPGMDTTGLWQVSHIKNNINHSLLVRANSKEEAINKVVKHSPNSEIIGVNEYPIPHFGEPILDSSVKDGLYGAFTMNINSLDDINLTNLVKSIRDYIKQHWNSDIAEINTDDVTTSSGSPKLNFSFREKRSSDKNGRWELSTGTIVIEPSYSLVDKYYTENKKYGEKKLNSEIANKLKQYAHKTIYKNASITRDSAIKDAYIDEWYENTSENAYMVAKRYGVSVKPIKKRGADVLYRFEGSIDKLNRMHSDGYFMSIDMAGNSIKDSSIKDADSVEVEKIIRKEKSALGITYYLFQTKSKSGATIYYEVTDKTYHGEPTYSGGGVISFSLQSANDSLDSHLLYDKLVSKYGKNAGRKRFLLGKNDTGIKDAKPYSIKYKNKQYKVYAKDEQTAVEKLNNLLNKVTDKPIK